MALVEAPSVSGLAVLFNGLATVTFQSKPYSRVVILLDFQNPTSGAVAFYRGGVSGAFTRIAGNSSGSNTQWTSPFKLPAGQNLFVQWTNAPSPVNLAMATMTWMEQKSEPGRITFNGYGRRRTR